MIQLGQYPAASQVIAHFSDPHFLAEGRPLFGEVDTLAGLAQALAQLERSGIRPSAIVFTGDLADLGEPDAYERLREVVAPAADRMGSRIIWVMGNHDERIPYQTILFDEPGGDDPQDRVYDLDGLRIVALDTTVPGYHHGAIDASQREWLSGVLSTRATHGTLLAMHHPPIPTPIELMALLELREQQGLAEVIRDTDVRGILAGHLHYSTHGLFAGIPISVASATCYTLDVSAPRRTLSGVSGGQAFSLVHVYADQLVFSSVPVGRSPEVSGFDETILERIAEMSPEERIEAFSKKRSTFTAIDPGDQRD